METNEKRNNEKEFRRWPNMFCCGRQGGYETMADYCKGFEEGENFRFMMSKCIKVCRWFPLFPVVIGIGLFLLGYFLSPEVTRILYMIAAGFMILMGIFCLLMMSKMKQTFGIQK